jgi:hypothetical protein
MQTGRTYWPGWASQLDRWGIKQIAAAILSTDGPLPLFLAQFAFASQPFLQAGISGVQLSAFEILLEYNDEREAFADFLREEKLR